MADAPRLSLCIPTSAGRAPFLKVALASAIQEALAHPAGMVEVLVSDNGSPEPTPSLLREFQERYPWLRCIGFPEDRGFDPNYLNCVQQARGEFVWVMGDDDMFLPGAVARVLQAMDAGADAILCGAFECDLQMKPLQLRGWFKEPTPATVWHLDRPQDLIDYYGRLRFMAGAFAFISAAIYRRERYLEGLPTILKSLSLAYVHAVGMTLFLASPTCLHWVPEPLFLNRLNDPFAARDPWGRLMHDLKAWLWIADTCFSDQPEVRRAFLEVLRHNHQPTMIQVLRIQSGADRNAWLEARWRLLEVGFDPTLVHALAFGHDLLSLDVPPPRNLDPEALCLADLPMVVRGARRVAVLAGVSLEQLRSAAPLLEALGRVPRDGPVRVVCPPALAPHLAGFDLQSVDRDLFLRDDPYMNAQLEAIRAYGPDLVVNLDRRRGITGDLLVDAAGAAGSLGFDDETRDNRDDPARLKRSRRYRKLLAQDAPWQAVAEALGLPSGF